MRRIGLIGFLLVTSFAFGDAAYGNDSAAALGVGGLRFQKVDGISMQREDLHLSRNAVRIRYEMRNDRGETYETRVAFPLPDYAMLVPVKDNPGHRWVFGSPAELPFPDDDNFVGFKTIIDGIEVSPEIEVRAILEGRDITEELQALGINVSIDNVTNGFDRRAIPAEITKALLERKLAEDNYTPEYAERVAVGEDLNVAPRWSIRVTFHWLQRFKAGITVVEHRYAPLTGGHMVQWVPDENSLSWIDGWDRKYCLNSATEKRIEKLARNRALFGHELSYILQTARNWDGPIGRFHLTLEGSTADAVITTCLPDLKLKRTGPSRFEASAANYVPTNDLAILFIER